MIIENGEEVEFLREIIYVQQTKLYLIKKNTTNPEELMVLKPRERSNSITKIEEADIPQLENKESESKSEPQSTLLVSS